MNPCGIHIVDDETQKQDIRNNQNHTQSMRSKFEPFKYRNQFHFVDKFNKNGNELTRARQAQQYNSR